MQHMKIVQHEKSATWNECNTKKVQHEKSVTREKCNIKKGNHEKVQHEQSIVTKWYFKKIVQEECTRMQKWIKDHPLNERYRGWLENISKINIAYLCGVREGRLLETRG